MMYCLGSVWSVSPVELACATETSHTHNHILRRTVINTQNIHLHAYKYTQIRGKTENILFVYCSDAVNPGKAD